MSVALPHLHALSYRVFVSDDGCTRVRIFRMADRSERIETERRDSPDGTWSHPVTVREWK